MAPSFCFKREMDSGATDLSIFFFAKKINYNLGILELVLFMNELSVSMILIICMTLTLVSNFHIKGFRIALNEV